MLVAELALSRGDYKVALENYSRVAKETQDPKISRRATEIALLNGALAPALDAALLWAKTDPNNIEAKLTASAILIQAGNPNPALAFLKQIDQLKPQEASDQFLILYKQLEDPVTRKSLVGLLEQLKTKASYLALAEIYLFQSEASKALDTSEKALSLDPNKSQAMILYIQALVANNQVDKAKTFLDTQLKKHPNSVELKFFFVQFYETQGNLSKAHEQLNSLSKMEGLNASELFVLARLSMEGKWFDQSEALLKKLEKFPEQSDIARYFLGKLSEVESKPNQAIEWYLKVENPPFYSISRIRTALLYNELNRPNTGLEVLNSMEAEPEEERTITLAKIELLAAMQNYTKALVLIDELLKETPNDAELLNAKAVIKKRIAEKEGIQNRSAAPSVVGQH